MSFEQVRINIQKHLSENFTEVASTQIAWDNVKFKPTNGTPWVRFSIQGNISNFVSIGGTNVKTRRLGLLFAQVFIPEGTGTLRANQIADAVKAQVEATSLATGEVFKAATQIEVGNSSPGWYQLNVSIPFHYDEQVEGRTILPPDVTAPIITSASSITIDENTNFLHSLVANESVIWSIVGGADQALFSLTDSILSMTAKDYEAPEDANNDNVYTVTVRATDNAGNTTNQTINVTINNVSETTRSDPLSDFVASTVFDLDVTLSDSYSGTGQNWYNLIASPADGSAQSAYIAHNGTSPSADSSDFTFNGSADSPDAYWSSDGGDRMKWLSGTTNFIKQLHRTDIAQDWTVVWAGKLPPDSVGAEFAPYIRTGAGTGASQGLILQWYFSGLPRWQIQQFGDSASSVAYTSNNVPTYEEDFVLGMGYDHVAGEITFWANSTTGETVSMTFATATANAAENWLFTQSANIANGGRVRAISGFNEKLSDADFTKVAEHYELRHNRSYLV